MFDWVGDVIDWIGDGVSSAWDNTVGVVTSDAARMIFDVIFNCIFIMIYDAIADIFTWINETSADIFDLAWINAFISLFHHIGWGLFVCGLIIAVFDTAIGYENGQANIKGTCLNALKGFFACSLVTVVPPRLYSFCISLQHTFATDLISSLIQNRNVSLAGEGLEVIKALNEDTSLANLFFMILFGSIQKMYRLWCDMEQSKHDFYSSAKADFPAMVNNEHFKSVKNMIIKAAAEIRFDFPIPENDNIPDAIEDDNDSGYYYDYDAPQNTKEEQTDNTRMYIRWSYEYKAAVKVLADKESSDDEKLQALQQLKAEADKGNILAVHDMGKHSDESYYEKALQGFLQIEPSAKKLRPYIQYRIGKMYLYGSGTEKAPETAFKWLEQSAIAGNKYAQHNLANMFCYGTGTQKDLSKAFLWYSEAARLGMRFADYALAQMYYYGSGVEQNIEHAQEHYRKALFAFLSYDMDEKLLYKIGRMYYCGLGTEVDKLQAMKYLSKSAEQGNMQAKRIVAQELLSGEYIQQDIPCGLAMLTECADSGDTSAAYKLGKVYFKGEYVPANHDRAESYLKIAVAANNRDAIYTLAKLYLTDERKNVPQAIKLLEAVAADNMWASYRLGRIYYFGADGVAPDREKGMTWLMQSAADGNIYAQSIIDNSGDHENALLAESVIGLLSSLSRIISDDYNKQQRKLGSQVDKKLRRAIDKKKQELGIKSNYGQSY